MNKNQKLAQWLELRISYDAKARNLNNVEASCQEYLKRHKKLKIVDLGAGTRANCRYYFSKIYQDQEWFLVEQNQELLEIAFDRIIAWAWENGYESQLQNSRLVLKNQVHNLIFKIFKPKSRWPEKDVYKTKPRLAIECKRKYFTVTRVAKEGYIYYSDTFRRQLMLYTSKASKQSFSRKI